MSEVKRYELVEMGMTYHKAAEMLLAEDGLWVDYDDYTELKAQRDALAAECATLMDANDLALDILCDDNTFVATEWKSSTAKVRVETPATEAYLNAVRAEAVNHAGRMIIVTMNHQDKGVKRALECIAEVELQYALAAQLRAGEPS